MDHQIRHCFVRATTISGSRLSRLISLALLFFIVALAATESLADSRAKSITAPQLAQRLQEKLPAYEVFTARILAAEAPVEDAKTLPAIGLQMDREEVFVSGAGIALKNSVSVNWSLDLSSGRQLRVRSARQAATATRLQTLQARRMLELHAFEVFYTAAREKLRLQSLQSTRVPLAKLVKRFKSRVQAGDASGLDLARFELELSKHDQSILETSVKLEVVEFQLATILGWPPGQRLIAQDALALPAITSDKSALAQAALTRRHDLRAADSMRASGLSLVEAAGQWWIPTIEISAGYLNTDFGPGSGPGSDVAHGYLVGIDLSVPLFSRGKAERKQGQARIRQAEAERTLLERQVATAVATSMARLKSRVEQSRNFESRQLVQATDLAAKTEAAYQGGEASALALRDAYQQSSAMELRNIELRYLSRLAEIEVWRAAGLHSQGESK